MCLVSTRVVGIAEAETDEIDFFMKLKQEVAGKDYSIKTSHDTFLLAALVKSVSEWLTQVPQLQLLLWR